ncbi:hypothetical protein ACFWZY_32115 [Streptomyces sp. NPDC058992]|uniref:hypothetical protein n=1 Tax=Streptomyces sp. NPDC058992 TaxID=3346688 RepID=UPI0036B5C0A7
MTRPDPREEQIAAEAQRLREASERLLAGNPQRSDGKLTVSTLATEAGIPRHRLYEHHAQAVSQFKVSAGGGPLTPNQQALTQRLADAAARAARLESDNRLLQQRITTLSAVIAELTHQAHGANIVPLPPRGHRPPSPRTVG